MAAAFDLEPYLRRIDWRGGRSTSVATLAGVLAAHLRRVPFENFDVLLGRPISLELPALQAKIVDACRGGYCFEHATLLAAALDAMGFPVRRHLARVVLFQPAHEAPRDHMFLTVKSDGAGFVVDPGFGPFAPPTPVPLDGTATAHGYRIARDGPSWVLHGRRRGEAFTGWSSRMEDDNPIDFEMSNHFKSTHPGSVFRQWIFASAVTPTGRVSVMNRDVTLLAGETETHIRLDDREALRALLRAHFGFDLPEAETLAVPAIPEWTNPPRA